MSGTVTKRLHVSGLTSSLTPADLSTRFSSFGTVKSLDGFGLLDGVGNPRKFGYVTLEATPAALKRCLTALSGTTWKGAKLRIGEARPEYRQRLMEEREAEEPPPKRRRTNYSKYHAVLSSDMSLVTRENAVQRPGWKVMPSGRIVRPMQMRPERPLPPSTDGQKTARPVKEKKRVKAPDTRARRRAIDVTKWGGVYLRGSLLDGQITMASLQPERMAEEPEDKDGEEDGEGNEDQRDGMIVDEDYRNDPKPTTSERQTKPPITKPAPLPPQETTQVPNPLDSEIAQERTQNLHLLQALLGDAEWGGRESDSDIDIDESRIIEGGAGDDMDYEIVPVAQSESTVQQQSPPIVTIADPEAACEGASKGPAAAPAPKVTSLKDLFKPQEDEGGFSLLNQLDIDIDEGLDAIFGSAPAVAEQPPASVPQPIVASSFASTKARTQQRIYLDPKTPLFFLPAHGGTSHLQGKAADSPFYQAQTGEQIRQRWEENKVELTRGWKKRWREAVKVKRRRGGRDGDAEV
ncbi:ribosome biogenesis protein nop6 [Moniliophthora roreri MCA 2997]|uniref:Ribosome biogenesis protein nop6 n=2 Tax=Moniliophthora roreri TaxID=221103 RepID=V2XPZ7_MONRO|nr:ribosome biogenesis protein nop6 [Moniliophthora roreri MCA 2997]KAI3608005.1 ribosome biogenesis protein nop6 [Moniliophthora roreri]